MAIGITLLAGTAGAVVIGIGIILGIIPTVNKKITKRFDNHFIKALTLR